MHRNGRYSKHGDKGCQPQPDSSGCIIGRSLSPILGRFGRVSVDLEEHSTNFNSFSGNEAWELALS